MTRPGVGVDGGGRAVDLDGEAGGEQRDPLGLGGGQLGEVHGPAVERGAVLDARELEHVVDQRSRPPRLAHEGGGETLAALEVAVGVAHERLGEGLDARDRRPQLVGGVREEPPGAHLGAAGLAGRVLGARLGGLELVEHRVEGGGRASQLGVGALGTQPPAPVAGRDVARQDRHVVERAQRDPHADEQGPRDDGQPDPADADHDHAQPPEDAVVLARLDGQHQPRAVGQGDRADVVASGARRTRAVRRARDVRPARRDGHRPVRRAQPIR